MDLFAVDRNFSGGPEFYTTLKGLIIDSKHICKSKHWGVVADMLGWLLRCSGCGVGVTAQKLKPLNGALINAPMNRVRI